MMRFLRDLVTIVRYFSTEGGELIGIFKTVGLLLTYEKSLHLEIHITSIIEDGFRPSNDVVFIYDKHQCITLYRPDIKFKYCRAMFLDGRIWFSPRTLRFAYDYQHDTSHITTYRTSVSNTAEAIRLMRIQADLFSL